MPRAAEPAAADETSAEEGDDETTTAKNIKPTLDATTEREPLRRRCKAVAEASAATDRS